MNADEASNKRKERRYKTCDARLLSCNVFVDVEEPVAGSVIDISTNGLRLLCGADFRVGCAFLVELETDRLHGVYPGIVRRVTPWVGGESVLGCQLLEPIPDKILQTLAKERVLNRRREDRVVWNKKASMKWELESKEVDVLIVDCSPGGLKLHSTMPIVENTCLRLTLDTEEAQGAIIDVKTVWQSKNDDDESWSIGVTFIRREIPSAVVKVLNAYGKEKLIIQKESLLRIGALVLATVATIGLAVAVAN